MDFHDPDRLHCTLPEVILSEAKDLNIKSSQVVGIEMLRLSSVG